MFMNLLRLASAGLLLVGTMPEAAFQGVALAQTNVAANAPPAGGQAQQHYTHEQLDAMLAPIALYPDDLVTQVLMASTYPLDIVSASRWLAEGDNKSLKGEALEQALKPLPWDPSVKSLVPFPMVLANLNQHLDWTQKMGYAMTVQQSDVFASIQRLRGKAQASGHLASNQQMTVTTEAAAAPPPGSGPPPEGYPPENIVIQPANPEVVYVPQYDPSVVYGGWGYATPPVYWPPPPAYYGYYPGYYPGAALAAGIMWGTGLAIAGGLWGWASPHWGWGGGGVYNNINVNVNRYNNIGGGHWNGGGHWQGGGGRPGGPGGIGRPGGPGGPGAPGRPGRPGGPGGAGRPGGPGGAGRPGGPGGAGRPGGPGGAGRPGGPGGAGRPGGPGGAGRPGGMGGAGHHGGFGGGGRPGGGYGGHGGGRVGMGGRGGGMHGGGGMRGGGGHGGGMRGGGGRGGGRR